MIVNTAHLRRLQQLREIRDLSGPEQLDEQKALLRERLDSTKGRLPRLIREISAAYRRREFVNERKNAALALITICHERNLLDQLGLCWETNEERVLKRSHWFALALIEACETLLQGFGEMEPWFFSLVRLAEQLVNYAEHGFLCDPDAGDTVRQNGRYGKTLVYFCKHLNQALQPFAERAAVLGGIDATQRSLRFTHRTVKRELETSAARRARLSSLRLVLDTKRLALQNGGIAILSPELYKSKDTSRTHPPS